MTVRRRHTRKSSRRIESAAWAFAVRRRLLTWYDHHRRDLPWRRRATDPYAQWVAEIMLQQTRVDTVLRYYERFLRRFPDVASLARARHDTVLKRWEGLGYYRRALHLHRAARQLHRAKEAVPRSATALRRLPGVGEYTAAAIASIAFNEPVPAVDGNVARVIARLIGLRDDILTPRGRAQVHAVAADLLPRGRPGDFNQAWMDLGSEICTPRVPRCPDCPLASRCIAYRQGRTTEIPVRSGGRRVDRPRVLIVVAVFIHDSKMLVRRRLPGGLWSGLWEFPNRGINGAGSASRHARRLASDAGVSVIGRTRLAATVADQLTHRSLSFHAYVATVTPQSGQTTDTPQRWVNHREFRRLVVSTAHRRVFEAIREAGAVD